MTETFYRTGTYKVDHKTFGGIIYASDFNTDYRGKDTPNGSYIADRIIGDWIFDKKNKLNGENSNRKENLKRTK